MRPSPIMDEIMRGIECRRDQKPLLSLALAAGLILLAVVATGCGLTPTTTPRASDRWSKGKLVGTATLNNQVALQVDEAGNNYLTWVGPEHKLYFARLNQQAEVLVEQSLNLTTKSPLKPQLLLDTTGQLHLFWLDKGERGLQVFYARLSADGEVLQEATAISPPDQRTSHSSVVLDAIGQTLEVFWSDNVYVRPGCYHAALDWSGTVIVPAETLIPDGLLPAAQVDRQGFVHLAWRMEPDPEEPEFHYAVYDPQRRALGPEILAAEPLIHMSLLGRPTAGASFEGPWLGLDENWVYLAWVLEMRERTEVQHLTFYQALPQPVLGQRQVAQTFDYTPPTVTSDAVHVRGVDPSMTGQPQFLRGQPTHQVLAYFTQAPGLGNVETLQIATAKVEPERTIGQEIVNASRSASVRPNVALDSEGNLHLVWIDTAGFERYHVVYASTSPQAKATLNRITTYDVVDKVLGGMMRIFSAFFFSPLIVNWLLIPFGWLVLFALITKESDFSDTHGPKALGVAMLLQLVAKLFVFPGLLNRSLLGSMLSPALAFVLGRWIVPLILAALSAGAAWIYVKRAHSQSIFAAYFIYAIMDSFLTLIIYVAPRMA